MPSGTLNDLLSHHWLDLLALLFLVWRALAGYRNGFLLEAARIAGLIAGIVIAGQVSAKIATLLTNVMDLPDNVAYVVAFVLVLLVTTAVVVAIGRVATRLAKWLFLGWLNRLAGLALSLLTGVLLIQAVLLVMVSLDWQEALDAGPVASSSLSRTPALLTMLPPDLNQFVSQYIDLRAPKQ